MNPESQTGTTPSDGKKEAAPSGEIVSTQEQTPAADPGEQHFFRSADAPAVQDSFGPADADALAPNPADLRMQQIGRSVAWTAPEFVIHEKGANWYLKFFGASILVVAIVSLVTRLDIFSIIVAVVVCAIFGYASGRQPREMHYAVDDHGVSAGRSFHSYADFRGFSLVPEGQLLSLSLIPLKRFMPTMNVYLDPADQDRIMDVLSDHLPLEDHQADAIERLMHRIRF